MKTEKLISLGKIFAIAILILGVIHNVATFTPLIRSGLTCLAPGDFKAVMFLSLICGSSFILSGIVLVLLLKKVEQFKFLSSPILVIGVFLAISGILSVVFMFDNPFAWISFVLNSSMLIISIGLKFKVAERGTFHTGI